MESSKKEKITALLFRVLLCLVGSFLLAFGTGVFLTPANVVAGGISGIGIIINYFLEPIAHFYFVDIIVWALNIVFLILSFIFLGKRFTLHTLISTFAFPLFLTLITRTNMFGFISQNFIAPIPEVRLLLAGILGGLCVGVGCGLTFLGDGSTGGVDVLCFILAKYLGIKQSISSFVVDATIIVIGMCVIPNNIVPALIGILSALMSALMIHLVYVQSNTNYIADVITDKYVELNDVIVKKFDRTTTLIDAVGSYSNSNKKLLRFVFDKRESSYFIEEIKKIDPNAFVTVISAKKVFGEGFSALQPGIYLIHRHNKQKKQEKEDGEKKL